MTKRIDFWLTALFVVGMIAVAIGCVNTGYEWDDLPAWLRTAEKILGYATLIVLPFAFGRVIGQTETEELYEDERED